ASRPTLKGERSDATIHRIPASPFEAFLSGAFGRLGLGVLKTQDLVERIAIEARSIVIGLRRDAALGHWRADAAEDNLKRDRDLISTVRTALKEGEVLADDRDRLTLTLPVRAKFRGGRASLIDVPGAEPTPAIDIALVKAVARAHRFRELLESG